MKDENGQIIRSKKWVKERIVFLKAKVEDYENRIKNAKEEIKERNKLLK